MVQSTFSVNIDFGITCVFFLHMPSASLVFRKKFYYVKLVLCTYCIYVSSVCIILFFFVVGANFKLCICDTDMGISYYYSFG